MNKTCMVVVVASLLLDSGCAPPLDPDDPPDARFVRVVTDFDTEGLRVEGGVVSGCAGVEGRVFESVLDERLPLSLENATPLPLLQEDSGLAARLLNDDCEVVAFGCLPVQGDEDTDLEILVEVVEPVSFCGLLERCEAGTCGPVPDEDAGPALPDGVTRSPDGEGYCYPLEGYTCDCTPLEYFCETLGCSLQRVCDIPPPDFVEIVDEHGCPGFELVSSGETCFARPE